jgi:molybdopterin molybdotransferase
VSRRRDRLPLVTPFPRQDSALLHLYAAADALIVRPPAAPAAAAGDTVPVLFLD